MTTAGVPSPCINICRMDSAGGLCTGCLRSLDEIARWSRASDAEKREILAAVARRRAEAAPPGCSPPQIREIPEQGNT